MIRPKAVIFDIDGVLTDSMPIILGLIKQLFAEFNFPLPADDAVLAAAFGRDAMIHKLLPEEHKRDLQLKKRMAERFTALSVESLSKLPIMSGAVELLEFLKRRKMKLAIATNRRATGRMLLENLGILRYFDVIITGIEATNLKPHPEPLHLALKGLGITKEEALFVGDNEADLEAGRAAGIKTVLLTKKSIHAERIESLHEIKAMFGEQ